jgi:hypothetical protein
MEQLILESVSFSDDECLFEYYLMEDFAEKVEVWFHVWPVVSVDGESTVERVTKRYRLHGNYEPFVEEVLLGQFPTTEALQRIASITQERLADATAYEDTALGAWLAAIKRGRA